MKLYTTHCPKCKVIEKKLAEKGLEFELIDDMDEIRKVADKCGVTSAPLLLVDTGEVLDFVAANKWLATK